MEMQFIFLDTVIDEYENIPNALFLTKAKARVGKKEIQLPKDMKTPRLLDTLIGLAYEVFWKTAVNEIYSRSHGVTTKITKEYALSITPDNVNKGRLPDEFLHDLTAHELMNAAKKICNRKTVFLFPKSWSSAAEDYKDDLMLNMARGVSEFFYRAEITQEPQWAFLSLDQNADKIEKQKNDKSTIDPLKSFISLLHGEMLKVGGVNIDSWSRKSGAILLSGPTGSGKSYAAKLLSMSPQYNSKFVEINLGAVGESLLESRMRGYTKGAFTDAKKDSGGWFESAENGVLFLDEFQSTPLSFQVQLLDILNAVSDEVYVARVGADETRKKMTVKIIIAINEDIDYLLSNNRLRKDILYRIRHIESFPSLNERIIKDGGYRYLRGLMATYRWKSMPPVALTGISNNVISINEISLIENVFSFLEIEALSELANHNWDGNFRELERVAFDLYFEYDQFNDNRHIDKNRVINVLNLWKDRLGLKNHARKDRQELSDQEKTKLNAIQHALRESQFVIKNTLKCDACTAYNMKARRTLKEYLKAHKEFLDSDIRNDSKIIKFIS
jgi:DNA-binding NtrC family response regulator